jgi:hypothetical protein
MCLNQKPRSCDIRQMPQALPEGFHAGLPVGLPHQKSTPLADPPHHFTHGGWAGRLLFFHQKSLQADRRHRRPLPPSHTMPTDTGHDRGRPPVRKYAPTIWPRSLRSKATVAETALGASIVVQTPLAGREKLRLFLRHRRKCPSSGPGC